MHSSLPPSYDQSQEEARAEAAAAMLAYQNELPPSYEESTEETQHNIQANLEIRQALQNHTNAPSAPSPEDMQRWYNEDLEQANREQLWQQYNAVLADEIRYNQIREQIKNQALLDALNQRRSYVVTRTRWAPDIYDFLLMQCLIRDLPVLIDLNWRLNLFLLRTALSMGQSIGGGIYHVGAAAAQGVGSLVTNLMSPSTNPPQNNNPAAIIFAVTALIAAALVAPFAAWYTVAKCAKAITNLTQGRKIIRSLGRLTAATLGGISGVLGGMVVGAMVGSSIPGFGTLAGIIVGAVLGSMITAGAATLIMKQTFRLFAWLRFNSTPVISHTNPEKYRLSNANQRLLVPRVTISTMLQDIKLNKPKKSIFFADKEKDQLNERYNELLGQVKTNPEVSKRGYYLTNNTLFNWQGNHWHIDDLNNQERPPAMNPAYRGGR